MIKLEKRINLFLHLAANENRWNTTFVREIAKVLDEIEKDEGPGALITSSENPKFFQMVDLDWMQDLKSNPDGGDRDVSEEIHASHGTFYNVTNTYSVCD